MHLTLIEKKWETKDVVSFLFQPETTLAWIAGQYLHYRLPHKNPDNRKEERWFTISSAPYEGRVMLTTRVMSATSHNGIEKSSSFKRALAALPIGATVEVDEPEGDFIVDDPNTELIFIAGGIGITPYRAILTDLDHKKIPFTATLLYGSRDHEFIFQNELDAIASRNAHFKIQYVVAPDDIDEVEIRKAVPDVKKPIFYVSGPEPMVEHFEKMMLAMGIPDEHLKRDFFPGYTWP